MAIAARYPHLVPRICGHPFCKFSLVNNSATRWGIASRCRQRKVSVRTNPSGHEVRDVASIKTSRRQQTGDDKRGNSRDRAARKHWLLVRFGGICVHCEIALTFETVQADRINPGGSYRRTNVQAACGPCNRDRGNRLDWIPPRLRGLARSALVLAG